MKLKDRDIREILLNKLNVIYENSPETKIVNELGVIHGQSRIDVAVINGILHGFEIKSESDNLSRLPSQVNDYNAVFDKVTLVTQMNHLNDVREIVPKWWGILVIVRRNEKYHLIEKRKGRKNPKIDPFSVCHFLWKDEAIDILKERGLHKGILSKPRKIIYSRIIQNLTLEELRSNVSKKLRSRVYELNI